MEPVLGHPKVSIRSTSVGLKQHVDGECDCQGEDGGERAFKSVTAQIFRRAVLGYKRGLSACK